MAELTLADLLQQNTGTSEFDFAPRERNRHRMIASGMPDPNQSWADFNRQAFGNFGSQAMSMVPGLNAGVDSYNAYQEGRPVMAGVHAARGAAEVALPPLVGRYAAMVNQGRVTNPMMTHRGESGMASLPEGWLAAWAVPGMVNGPGLYGIRPSPSTLSPPSVSPRLPGSHATIEDTTATINAYLARMHAEPPNPAGLTPYQRGLDMFNHMPAPPRSQMHDAAGAAAGGLAAYLMNAPEGPY